MHTLTDEELNAAAMIAVTATIATLSAAIKQVVRADSEYDTGDDKIRRLKKYLEDTNAAYGLEFNLYGRD